MKLALQNGGFVLIDEVDFPLVSLHQWLSFKNKHRFYAIRHEGLKLIQMHRVLLGAKKGEICDHLNRNGLDNRRANIRIAGHCENNHNRSYKNKLGFRGVRRVDGGFSAEISNHTKREYLGFFLGLKAAARAYDVASTRIHGEHAVTNFGGHNVQR